MNGSARSGSGQGAPWGLAALLFLANSFSFVDRMVLTLLVEPIKADLEVSDTQISLLHGLAFASFYALAGLPLGYLADRSHRPRLMAIGATIWSAMTLATGLARSFPLMFAARAGVAVGEATLSPSAVSLLRDRFAPGLAARAIGIFQAGIFVGSALALILGGQILTVADRLPWPLAGLAPWRVVFVVAGLPGLVIAALMLTLREPRGVSIPADGSAPRVGAALGYVRANLRTIGWYIGGATAITILAYGVLSWMPTVLIRVHGMTQQSVGLTLGLGNLLCGVGGVLTSAWALDKALARGRRTAPAELLLLACGLLGVATVVFALAPTIAFALPAAAVLIFTQSLPYGIISASLAELVPAHLRGQIVALYLLISNLAGLTLGPLIVALFTDRLFADPSKVGLSLALLPVVTLPLACGFLLACRSALGSLHLSHEPAR